MIADPLDELSLPEAPAPVGAYERGLIRNGIGFLSGQFPLRGRQLAFVGRVGSELTRDDGRLAAELAALNAIAGIKAVLGGSFSGFAGLLRVDGYVTSVNGFIEQPYVLDGASKTFLRLLGDRGHHARAAIAVPQLPLYSPVELVVTFAVAVPQ